MNKSLILLLFSLLFSSICFSQKEKKKLIQLYKNAHTSNEKIKYSFLLAEHFLDTDEIDSSQKWLIKSKDLQTINTIDTTSFFYKSLQSELFYYNGLFQFGTTEAQKATAIAIQLKDSTLISNGYFFQGINFFEKKQYYDTEKALQKSTKFFPKKGVSHHIRSNIDEEYIYNNLAQVKLRINQVDSAFWYNKRAYYYALKNKSRRGIPNTEQTFGEIYLAQRKVDSAFFYFNKSIASATESDYYDVVLINYGLISQCYATQSNIDHYYQLGEVILSDHAVNNAYKKYFYTYILESYQSIEDYKSASIIQDKIIAIDMETRLKGNEFIQNISELYSKNENKLLSLEVEKLKNEKQFTYLQIIALSLFIFLLLLTILIFKRKNRIQKQLLEQKNEISKDLHDDIGSGLSSILIYSNLIVSAENNSDKLQLAEKINQTGTEISKRLHAFIWSLNADQNNLHLFSEYIKQYAFQLFDKTAMTFYFKNDIEKLEEIIIDGRFRKNLFYICKEVFNNSLKHSNATTVHFNIRLIDKKKLQIVIKDNGTGLTEKNPFGNGLKNIENRIQSINGTVSVKNDHGLTTTLLLTL